MISCLRKKREEKEIEYRIGEKRRSRWALLSEDIEEADISEKIEPISLKENPIVSNNLYNEIDMTNQNLKNMCKVQKKETKSECKNFPRRLCVSKSSRSS
ncbi:hypothetical protein M0802_014048 [Mischocyttarus mexicanus]|nr:hypothetical protein M0802_014048 [Mischocyttarus mexicanus]